MRIVIGVDPDLNYREATHLLGRLRFARSKIVLAHVNETSLVPVYAGGVTLPVEEPDSERIARADQYLRSARTDSELSGSGETFTARALEGPVAKELMELAEHEGADLVALGSRRRGIRDSVFLGSVGRAFAIGAHESFLIARSGVTSQGNVRAVFATDHSEYADKCADELLRMAPEGLGEVRFVFSWDGSLDELRRAAGVEDHGVLQSFLLDLVARKGQALVDKYREEGIFARYDIVDGFPIDTLRRVMYETKSELLVLGAKGHGFWSRLFVGSLALHCVVAEPFSVLIVRPRSEEYPERSHGSIVD